MAEVGEAAGEAVSFERVLSEELRALHKIEDAEGGSSEDPIQQAHHGELAGLALSGGGIRSATFALGVLQGLADLGLLARFDYLSTVSGGGYIGGWLQAWLRRERHHGGVAAVAQELSTVRGRGPGKQGPWEAEEIRFLREYSNYLTPKKGIFTADTWVMVAIYLRNLVLNISILLTLIAAVLIVPRSLVLLHAAAVDFVSGEAPRLWALGVLCALLGGNAVRLAYNHLANDPPVEAAELQRRKVQVYWFLVGPLVAAAILIALGLVGRPAEWWWGLAAALLYPAAWGLASLAARPTRSVAGERAARLQVVGSVTAVVSGFFGAALLGIVGFILTDAPGEGLGTRALFQATLGGPLVISVLGVTLGFQVGIAGNGVSEFVREWTGRLVATLLLVGLAIFAWFAVALHSAGPAAWLQGLVGDWAHGLTLSWVVSSLAGLWATQQPAARFQRRPQLAALVRLTPVAFALGLVVLLALVLERLVPLADCVFWTQHWGADLGRSWATCREPSAGQLAIGPYGLGWGYSPMTFIFALVLALAAVGMAWRVGINEFSMHAFYRNRLVRCYLGATRKVRSADPFCGFDPQDDRELDHKLPLVRPYFIVNATLNLVGGERLGWQLRRAASFAFTPLYSGYQPDPTSEAGLGTRVSPHGYRSTERYGGGVTLGTAMAISGAAVSPNMGWRTSPSLAFLMTLFNLRLGWWLGNPRHQQTWHHPGPTFGLAQLLQELLGKTNDRQRYVYLSDGGHFENLGIYELVRRRCRYIVVSDGGEDAERNFDDLGNAVEKCRADFGIDIEIDLSGLRTQGDDGLSPTHCAIGRIRYDKVDGGAQVGTLIYLKASLTGDEAADILTYARRNPAFPHQSTADQWFDEAQFEGYRALGHHVVQSCFGGLSADERTGSMEGLVLALRERWYSRSPESVASFTRHNAELNRICGALRSSTVYRFLDPQVYPEWSAFLEQAVGGVPASSPTTDDPRLSLPSQEDELRAGFYLCSEVIQLMENVYLDLDLERQWQHPDHRGWMNLFKHWSWSAMFRATWTIISGTTGARFQSFCRRHLDLGVGGDATLELLALDPHEDAAALLSAARGRAGPLRLNFFESALLTGLAERWRARPGPWSIALFYLRLAGVTASAPSLDFPIGFAVLRGSGLAYFRVQDHLRGMGLGRRALVALLRKNQALRVDGEPFLELAEPVTEEQWARLARLLRSARIEVAGERGPSVS